MYCMYYQHVHRYGQLSGMVEPLSGLIGTVAVVVSLMLTLRRDLFMHVKMCESQYSHIDK